MTLNDIYLSSTAEMITENHTDKNSCKQRWYVYNWGDFSFSTLFPSLRHRNNWQDIASTDILCSDHAWPACRCGRLTSSEASLVQCFAFYKTSSKTSGAIFLKIIVQNIASLTILRGGGQIFPHLQKKSNISKKINTYPPPIFFDFS